jgi:hypothetical protein
MAGDSEHFHVKTPAVDDEFREEVIGASGRQHLEAGLRVFDSRHRKGSDDPIPTSACYLAIPGLRHSDHGLLHTSRSDDDVVPFLEEWPEALDVIYGRRVVGVHEQPKLPTCVQHSEAYCRSLSVIAPVRVCYDTKRNRAGTAFFYNPGGTIGGPIVGDDDLCSVILAG